MPLEIAVSQWMKMAAQVRAELDRADLTKHQRRLMHIIFWSTVMKRRLRVRLLRLEELEEVAGMHRGHISTNLRRLAKMRLIQIVPLADGGTEYVLLPDSSSWDVGWLYSRAAWLKLHCDLDAVTSQVQRDLLPPEPNLLAALAEVSSDSWIQNLDQDPESGSSWIQNLDQDPESGSSWIQNLDQDPESGSGSGIPNGTSEPWDQAEYVRLCQSGDTVAADKMWRDAHPPLVKGGKGGHDMHVPRRGMKKHDMHVQGGAAIRNQPWQPERQLDVGELDSRTAEEIWQALQKASGGAISQEFEAGWKRRIFEAAHVVWSIARECSERKDVKNRVGWLNREYLRSLCPE